MIRTAKLVVCRCLQPAIPQRSFGSSTQPSRSFFFATPNKGNKYCRGVLACFAGFTSMTLAVNVKFCQAPEAERKPSPLAEPHPHRPVQGAVSKRKMTTKAACCRNWFVMDTVPRPHLPVWYGMWESPGPSYWAVLQILGSQSGHRGCQLRTRDKPSL